MLKFEIRWDHNQSGEFVCVSVISLADAVDRLLIVQNSGPMVLHIDYRHILTHALNVIKSATFEYTQKYQALYYIPVRHDMMRQTNDCSPVRVMQHKVKYFLYAFSVRALEKEKIKKQTR